MEKPKSRIALYGDFAGYIRSVSLREPEILGRLRQETAAMPQARMQISPEFGQLMRLLLNAIAARQTLEIGVFTGYSSLCAALALPADGRVVACDVNQTWTDIARRYWREAGVESKIDLRLRPALETLDELLASGCRESFDFAFIDADKENYANYYERVLKLIRPGGLIAIDNVLWHGQVLDPDDQESGTLAIRAFNDALHQDSRVDLSLIPVGDGVSLAVKRR